MDTPIDPANYSPTTAKRLLLSPDQALHLSQRLIEETKTIKQSPYDPAPWTARASTLSDLGYPELAVGDAWNADRLCRKSLSLEQHDANRVEQCQRDAADIITHNLDEGHCERGTFISRQYPWHQQRHLVRGDDLLRRISQQPFLRKRHQKQKHRVGWVEFETGGRMFGVLAKVDLPAGTVILDDQSKISGTDGQIDTVGMAKDDAGKHTVDYLIRTWVDENKHNAFTSMLVALLSQTIQAGSKHPLDHDSIARLTPAYHRHKSQSFGLVEDIVYVKLYLLARGVDIFANLNFDTWILFTIRARLCNNFWSSGTTATISLPHSLINHSCEPNADWVGKSVRGQRRRLVVTTTRDVAAGEQLCICYDKFVLDDTVAARRAALERWIEGGCRCSRCVREMEEDRRMEYAGKQVVQAWDIAEH